MEYVVAAACRQLHGLQSLPVGTHGHVRRSDRIQYVPKLELGPLDDDFFGYAYEVDAANPDEAAAVSGSEDDVVHRMS